MGVCDCPDMWACEANGQGADPGACPDDPPCDSCCARAATPVEEITGILRDDSAGEEEVAHG